jgi:simple sugar transport system permease protein
MKRTSALAVVQTWLARRAGAPGSLSLAVTVVLFVALSLAGGIAYDGFLAPQVFLNLLIDNAFLLVVAVGMTFVILTGGIDLSEGGGRLHHRAASDSTTAGTSVGAASLACWVRIRRDDGTDDPALPVAAVRGDARRNVPRAGAARVESIGIDDAQKAVAGMRIPLGGGVTVGGRRDGTGRRLWRHWWRDPQFGRTVYAIAAAAALCGPASGLDHRGVWH